MSYRLPPELVVGYEEIDLQHRTLFERLDAVLAAAKADDVKAARETLAKLSDYLMAHFGAEESFMAATHYPERGRHKSAHDLFMQDFSQNVAELRTTGLSVPVMQWLTARVPEWVKFHIQVNDVPLGRYLAAKRFRAQPEAARVDKPRVF
jgi:hemerythrin